MKTIAKTFVLFLLTANLFAQTSYNYTDIFFLNENHGWILGTNGNLWKTTNTGITWEHIYNNDISGGIGLQFTSPTTGWITKHSELFTSSDGGYTWRVVFTNPYTVNRSNSYFNNDSIGFISSDTTLFRTTDSGDNWEAIEDTLGSFIRTYFYDENLGFLIYYEYIGVGNFTYVYKTTDLGNTWILSNECTSLEYCGFGKIKIINSTNAIMSRGIVNVVPTYNLIKTTDGGNSWNSFPSPNFAFGSTDYEFLSIEHGWITTNSKLIVRTTNMGSNWDTLQTPLTLDDVIKNFEFFNSNISYGISSNHIFFTNDGWVTYSVVDSIVTNVENPGTIPNEFILYQNYPNPFNPATVISYQIPVSGDVILKVYDLLGRETATLIDEYKPAGRYEFEFNASALSSGVYYYQLIAGNKIQTNKMLLLK